MRKLKYLLILTYISSLCFLLKSIGLFTMPIDGDGIGLDFLGIEINDRLPNAQIPQYAWTFLLIGALLMLISVAIHRKTKIYKV